MLTWQMQIHVFYFLTFASYNKYNTQVGKETAGKIPL